MRQFKIWIALVSVMTLAACASTGGAPKAADTLNANRGQEYTKVIVPQALRSFNERGKCPRQSGELKVFVWREQVKIASACVAAGQWQMVEMIGRQMAETEHLAPWGAYFLSLSAEARKDLPRAVWMIELALKKAPKSGLLTYQKGRLEWQARDQQAALKSFKAATDLEPRLVDAQLILGQMALIAGDMTEAGRRFEAALESEPRHLPALLGLAEVRVRARDPKRANEALTAAVFNHPTSYRARLRQAQVLEELEKNLPEALVAYRRIRSLERERKLDAVVDVDLEAKIRELETVVAQAAPNQLSLRDPADDQKGDK